MEIDVVHYSARIEPEPEADHRYRVLVLLGRSDRPRLEKFNCPKCTRPVAEIMNAELLGLTDMMDMENLSTLGVGIRCGGRTGDRAINNGRCDRWYYFSVGGVE